MNGTNYTMGTDGTADGNGVDFDGDGLKLSIGGSDSSSPNKICIIIS